jgi:hypothetical protein
VGLFNTVITAELLQLAVGAANAREALLIVVGKQQLQIHLSGSSDLGGVGQDGHTVGSGIYASGDHTVRTERFASLLCNLYQTETACTDLIDVLQVAKSGNINFSGSRGFEDSAALFYRVVFAVYCNSNHFHFARIPFLTSWK